MELLKKTKRVSKKEYELLDLELVWTLIHLQGISDNLLKLSGSIDSGIKDGLINESKGRAYMRELENYSRCLIGNYSDLKRAVDIVFRKSQQ